jgi:hypothetical protein
VYGWYKVTVCLRKVRRILSVVLEANGMNIIRLIVATSLHFFLRRHQILAQASPCFVSKLA